MARVDRHDAGDTVFNNTAAFLICCGDKVRAMRCMAIWYVPYCSVVDLHRRGVQNRGLNTMMESRDRSGHCTPQGMG